MFSRANFFRCFTIALLYTTLCYLRGFRVFAANRCTQMLPFDIINDLDRIGRSLRRRRAGLSVCAMSVHLLVTSSIHIFFIRTRS